MYTGHFSFREPPFSIAPDPRYLYLSPQHREALAHLLYGISVGGGFVALTGEVGTGKTTLCRCLLEQLPEDVDIALIFNPRMNSRELLATLCDELHIAHPGAQASLKLLIDVLNHHLLDAHARGRRTIALIDEAQNLSIDVLEQIRLLTNLETNQAKLLQIILVGQPELNALLERPNLRQLSQRITARYHLQPLSLQETGDYLRHRLRVAGGRDRLFTAPAIRAIHRRSGGIPRLINLIADRALLGAFTLGQERVSWRVARKAARELLPSAGKKRWPVWASVLLLAAMAFGLSRPPDLSRFGHGDSPPAGTKAKGAETAAKPGITAAEQAAPPHPVLGAEPQPSGSLAERIAASAPTRDAALDSLLTLWHLPPATGDKPDRCAYAAQSGLHCLPLQGSWWQLRNLDCPAVLELVLPDGSRHYAALLRVGDGKAELALGETTAVYDLAEVLAFWKGAAVLLWKPPGGRTQPIAAGERSAAVRWIRQRLGVEAGPGNDDLFDPNLKARVMSFQMERGLSPDGIVGPQTLIHLGLSLAETGQPRLESVLH